MKINQFSGFILFLCLFCIPWGCRKAPTAPAPTKRLTVVVSIEPLSWVVGNVAGEYADCQVLLGRGASPATYEPTPRQMTALSEARLFCRIGMPFEHSLIQRIKANFPDLQVIDTRANIPLLDTQGNPIHSEEKVESGHSEPGHSHGAGQPDPHIWLDPLRMKQIAQTIAGGLIQVDASHEGDYRKNLTRVEGLLDSLDEELSRELSPFRNQSIFVFHPAYGYLTGRYGLRQVSIEEEGKEPAPGQLAEFIEQAKTESIKIIFVQPQFSQHTAEKIAGIVHAELVVLDPLERDYAENLRAMARHIRRVLSKETSDTKQPTGK